MRLPQSSRGKLWHAFCTTLDGCIANGTNGMLRSIATLLTGLATGAALLAASGPAAANPPADACGVETERQERMNAIPPGLLTAISHVESGRYDKASRATIAWPWTVMAEGKGRFLPSKAAAIAEVAALQARGVRNIDVGCMQINLHAHRNAFPDLNTAFDPRANVAYAAKFLIDLHRETGSWATTGTHYHSRTPHLAAIYRVKLALAWAKTQSGDGTAAVRVAAAPAAGRAAPGQMVPVTSRATPVIYRAAPQEPPSWSIRAAERTAKREQTLAEREAARKAAEAWRQEKLSAYHLRRVKEQ